MRKNWLALAEVNSVCNGARGVAAAFARRFRTRPVVPDAAFQDAGEPAPWHWRRFPAPWPPVGTAQQETAQAALDELPDTWRQVVLRHDAAGHDDRQIAAELGLTVEQVRAVLARARAAVRDRLDTGRAPGGPAR